MVIVKHMIRLSNKSWALFFKELWVVTRNFEYFLRIQGLLKQALKLPSLTW